MNRAKVDLRYIDSEDIEAKGAALFWTGLTGSRFPVASATEAPKARSRLYAMHARPIPSSALSGTTGCGHRV